MVMSMTLYDYDVAGRRWDRLSGRELSGGNLWSGHN